MKKVTFLISNKCNFKCKHCFVNGGLPLQDELSTKNKYKAIENLKKIGVKKVTFSGGEPLLDKRIFEYMLYAKKIGLDIGFLTNGCLLDENKILELKKLVNTFSISLYTNDILEITNDAYKKYLNKMIEDLKILTNCNLKFKITILISKGNHKDVIKLLEILENERIKPEIVRIYIITPLGRAKNNYELCTENINSLEIIKEFSNKLKKSNLKFAFEYTRISSKNINNSYCYKYCPIINYKDSYINDYADPHMDANGDLYLCGLLLRNKEYCIGNILKDNKEKIIQNINQLIEKIKNQNKNDCCPALQREEKNGTKLVCPVMYFNEKGEVK